MNSSSDTWLSEEGTQVRQMFILLALSLGAWIKPKDIPIHNTLFKGFLPSLSNFPDSVQTSISQQRRVKGHSLVTRTCVDLSIESAYYTPSMFWPCSKKVMWSNPWQDNWIRVVGSVGHFISSSIRTTWLNPASWHLLCLINLSM